MRTLVLLSLLVAVGTDVMGQAPAPAPARPAPGTTQPPRPAQPTPQPAQPAQPAPRRATPPVSTRAGMAITVTTPRGTTIAGVAVEILGTTERKGETNASGQINFPGLQAGTYRVRFSGDEVTTFEREVTVRAGQIADLDITLNPAPPPRVVSAPAPATPPPAPPAAAPVLGRAGQPQQLSVVDLIEKEFIGRQRLRETLLSCSGNARTTVLQLNENLAEQIYDTGEATYYVVVGEGAVSIGGKESALEAGSFVSVPRGTAHSFIRRGRRPLILLTTLSGAPCEQVK